MILLNINEKQWYIHKEGFAENVINDMFKEYFNELYQEDAVKWRISEIWEKISIKIPKQSVFVEKDSILYSVSSSLEFELAPEDFFEIDEVSHPILIECFEKCYAEFKNLMKNYRNWNEKNDSDSRKTDSIANVYLQTAKSYVPRIESLARTLHRTKHTFSQILNVSLKPKMCAQTCPKIAEVYENALLQSNPIMLITKTTYHTQKIYAITENLEVEEVTYSLIERELEEIIHEIVPEDTDFLVNRIYNFMMLPLSEVKACIRINKVQEEGINATMFLEEKDIPVVCNFNLKSFYAFLRINHNEGFPVNKKIRYHRDKVCVEPISPRSGVEKLQSVNKTMFDEMSCYVEFAGKKYKTYNYSSTYGSHECSTRHNILYKIKNGKVENVYEDTRIREDSSEYQKFKAIIEKEGEKASNQGSYSFWEITFEENE